MAAPIFTPAMLRAQFENLVDDSYDITHTYQLLTQAKNRIERMLKLYILQAGDSSQVATIGDTYLTLKSVPSDFREMLTLYINRIPYTEIPFAKRIAHQNAARRFYIDYKKMVQGQPCLGICGRVGASGTLDMTYMASTPDLTEADEDTTGVVLWPDEFQPIIPYAAAKVFQANIDPDDISIRQAVAQNVEMQDLLDAFIGWDHDLKLAAMDHRGGYSDDTDWPIDVGTL